jgi:putrescine aminotransferase
VTTSASRDQVLARYTRHVNKSLASLARLIAAPVEVAAAGSKVLGSDGHTYLDCGGFGVFLLGHCHPAVVAAVRSQLERNPLATRLFLNPELAQAAADLAGITPSGLDYVFLTNSGTEATELGLKLPRLAGKRHVIAMHGGFHGKTPGALSVTGQSQYRDPFGPLLPMIDFIPFGDIAALRAVLTAQSVVLLEPVQAEGGVRLPPDGYLRQVRQACTEAGAVMILDEIQSGMGRLGAWWGADLAGVTPDVLLTGKILGGGVMPAGGVVASEHLFAPLNADPLLHSSTFAGNPLAAAAVTATIGAIKSEGLIQRTPPRRISTTQHSSIQTRTRSPNLPLYNGHIRMICIHQSTQAAWQLSRQIRRPLDGSCPARTADIACRVTVVELSPSVAKCQCLVRAGQVCGGSIPADRSCHGERHRVVVGIARGLRSGPSGCRKRPGGMAGG